MALTPAAVPIRGIKMICDSDPKVQHDYVGTAKDSDVRSAQSEMR